MSANESHKPRQRSTSTPGDAAKAEINGLDEDSGIILPLLHEMKMATESTQKLHESDACHIYLTTTECIKGEEPGSGEESVVIVTNERAAWGGKIEFILTSIGFAVGLGNVWRFPYLVYKNGGGAFLIPYVIMLILLGLPLFFLEFAFGQFASLGPISVWSISPLFKGIGLAMVIISFYLALYYNVIISQCVFYFFASMTSTLPWSTCNQYYNQPTLRDNRTCLSMEAAKNAAGNQSEMNLQTMVSSAEQYYERYVLQMSSGINEFGLPTWQLSLCLLFSWIIVCLVLLKGIQSLGKVAYFTALFPYVMLTILFIRGLTLEGSKDGVMYYITPNFTKLTEPNVWTDAATQIFFAFSCCNGGLIAMSSYNPFKNNCCRDALIVAIINVLTSIYAGFVVFTNLGYMAHLKNVSVDSVAKGGPGLAFIVYPEALSNMPVSSMWSIFFFLMMLTLGFGSQFSIVETVISGIQDELRKFNIIRTKMHNYILRIGTCFVCFLLGLTMCTPGGMFLLNLLDTTVSGFPLLVIAMAEIVVICFFYGVKQFERDIEMMIDSKPNWYWRITWCGVSPICIACLLFFYFWKGEPLKYQDKEYPAWAQVFSKFVGILPISFIPIMFFYRYCKEGGWILFREYIKPKQNWGPAHQDHREQFIDLIRSQESLRKQRVDEHSAYESINGISLQDVPAPDVKFFQNKLNAATKLSRAASKESMNKTRSTGNLHQSSVMLNPSVRADIARLAGSAVAANSSSNDVNGAGAFYSSTKEALNVQADLSPLVAAHVSSNSAEGRNPTASFTVGGGDCSNTTEGKSDAGHQH